MKTSLQFNTFAFKQSLFSSKYFQTATNSIKVLTEMPPHVQVHTFSLFNILLPLVSPVVLLFFLQQIQNQLFTGHQRHGKVSRSVPLTWEQQQQQQQVSVINRFYLFVFDLLAITVVRLSCFYLINLNSLSAVSCCDFKVWNLVVVIVQIIQIFQVFFLFSR